MTRVTGFERIWAAVFAGSLVVLLAAVPLRGAGAAEGVIQINQAKALAGGVTPGDGVGFPVSITESGSYVLTGNLTLADTATTAIEVTADWVTIDLNGFEITAPNSCTWNGSDVDCTASSTGDGIQADSQEGLTVRGGTIRGMGDNGIEAGTGARVENVTADGNGGVGIDVYTYSYVTRSRARLNETDGIMCGYWCILDGNASRRNGHQGLQCSGPSIVRGNTSVENNNSGIAASSLCLVHDNVAEDNGHFGIYSSSYSNVQNNTASGNGDHGICGANNSLLRGNAARQNTGSGIATMATGGSILLDNTAEGNGVWGLGSFAGDAYSGNNLYNNSTGTVQGGTQLRSNLCAGNTSCP